MRILAVDDDPFIIQVLELALSAMGFDSVATARCAHDAMELVDHPDTCFDCILLDIQMPEVDGIELCEMIREVPGYARTPIIMLTAMSERHYIERAFEAGANDYISKPFETVELAARIRMAEQLSKEIRSKEGVERELSLMSSGLDFQPAVNFEDALGFEDMPGHLDLPTLKNYLDRIKRSHFRYGGVMALKIRNISEIFGKLNGRDFINFVADVGDAISLTLSHERVHFSYAGSGYFLILFLCVPKVGFAREVRRLIQAELDSMELRYPDTRSIGTTIEVSRIQGTELFGTNTVNSVVQTAINDVETVLAADTKVELRLSTSGVASALRVTH
ncbi:MAG: response regulator [Rhodobacter sp.]|nr:response regulator [Rhodobacter sp.]